MSDGEVRDYRSLGEILREAREAKGWTVEELHEHTRIAPRMVRALENDDIDQFDSPVYARGFVRQLAGSLDLDPDWLLTKLGVPERSAEDAPAEVVAVETPSPAKPAAPPTAPPVSERGPVWEVESVRVRKVVPDAAGGPPWKILLGAAVVVVLIGMGVVIARMRGEAPAPATSDSALEVPVQTPVPATPTVVDAGSEDTGVPDAVVGDAAVADDDATGEPPRELVADSITQGSTPSTPARADEGLEWHPSTDPAQIAARRRAERPPTPEPAVADVDAAEQTPAPAQETRTSDPPADEAPQRTEPAVTRAAPDRGGRQRNEVVESAGLSRGLPSVVRGEGDVAAQPMRLVVRARARVEVDITLANGTRERRFLEAGEEWVLEGADHFLVRANDPDAADFELDGILRDPPPRWTGAEWFLHRPTENAPE